MKQKRAGQRLGFRVFRGSDGNDYLVFRSPSGAYHTFVEVQAKEAARACGGPAEGTTRQRWDELWNGEDQGQEDQGQEGKAAEKPEAQAEQQDQGAGKGGATRYKLFGFAITAVLRWMGRQGWTFAEARRVMDAYHISCADNTIRKQMSDGKLGKAEAGPPAQLTEEQVVELQKVLEGLEQVEVVEEEGEQQGGVTSETMPGPTPNGGAYSTAYYLDEQGRPADKTVATHIRIVEFDEKNEPIHRTYGTLKGG